MTLLKFDRNVETPFVLTRFKSIEDDLYNVNLNKRDKNLKFIKRFKNAIVVDEQI